MVVISDLVNDTTDIHPKDKHDVGIRLANWALAETYHQAGLIYKNPQETGVEVNGDKVTVNISNAPNGLMVKGGEGPAKGKGSNVSTLVVAGEDHVFYPAMSKVEGDKLIVWAKQVKKPVAVRYQFSSAGMGNLFSKDGLPVAPFRTDNW